MVLRVSCSSTDKAAVTAVDMTRNIVQHLLKAGETVMWTGKPKLVPFVVSSLGIVLFGLVWLIVPTAMVLVLYTQESENSLFGTFAFQLFLVPFFLIGILMVLSPVYYLLVHRFIEYAITNQRIIIIGGLVGRDLKVVGFDEIKNISVQVGLIDKLYGTGKIRFFSGEVESSGRGAASKYDTFQAIRAPYSVFRRIQNSMETYRAGKL